MTIDSGQITTTNGSNLEECLSLSGANVVCFARPPVAMFGHAKLKQFVQPHCKEIFDAATSSYVKSVISIDNFICT